MIDHVFMFIEADGPEISHLASLGLVETYRRVHSGQGTRNICYCFDNMFLELLWVDDRDALRSKAVERTALFERSLWQTNGKCPFGIGLRRSQNESPFSFPSWDFRPPYLPAGMSIPVAIDSEDPIQPLIFESPGTTAPTEWPVEKRGSLQHSARLGAVTGMTLTMPPDSPPSDALITVVQSNASLFRLGTPGAYRLDLRIASLVNEPELQITLPLEPATFTRRGLEA